MALPEWLVDQLLHLDQEATALVGKEWWPGKVIEVHEDGALTMSFYGWNSKFNERYSLEEQAEKVRFEQVGKRKRRAVDRTPVVLPSPKKPKPKPRAKPKPKKKPSLLAAPLSPAPKKKPSKRMSLGSVSSLCTITTPKKRERVLQSLRCAACTEVAVTFAETMVQCRSCHEYMHRGCLGVPVEESNSFPEGFICPLCELLCEGSSATLHLGNLKDKRYVRHIQQQLEGDRVMECDMRRVVQHLAKYDPAVAKRCRGQPNGVVRSHLCDCLAAMLEAAPGPTALDLPVAEAEEPPDSEDPCLEEAIRERAAQCPTCCKWWPSQGDDPVIGCDTCGAWIHRKCAGLGLRDMDQVKKFHRFCCPDCKEASALAHGGAPETVSTGPSPAKRLATVAPPPAAPPSRADQEATEAAYVAAKAKHAARRMKGMVSAQGGGPAVRARECYWACRRAVYRARTALAAAKLTPDGLVGATFPATTCKLDDGRGDIFFFVFRWLNDTADLERASGVCRQWRWLLDREGRAEPIWREAWLHVPSSVWSVKAAVESAPPGTKIRVRAGTYGDDLDICRGILLEGEPGARITGTITITGGDGGLIRGLEVRHYMVQAITVSDATWRIEKCDIRSSRKMARACSGLVVKDNATVHLEDSVISTCTQGLLVHAPSGVFTANKCRFENHRDGMVARWGSIHVKETHLSGNSTPLRLAPEAWDKSTFQACHVNGLPFTAVNGELTAGGPDLMGFVVS